MIRNINLTRITISTETNVSWLFIVLNFPFSILPVALKFYLLKYIYCASLKAIETRSLYLILSRFTTQFFDRYPIHFVSTKLMLEKILINFTIDLHSSRLCRIVERWMKTIKYERSMYFSCIDGFFFKGRFFPYPRYFVSFLYSLIEFEIYQGERESIGNIFLSINWIVEIWKYLEKLHFKK